MIGRTLLAMIVGFVPMAGLGGPYDYYILGRVEDAEAPYDADGDYVLRTGALGAVLAVLRDPRSELTGIFPEGAAIEGELQAERATGDLPIFLVKDAVVGPWHGLQDAIRSGSSGSFFYQEFRSIPSIPRRILPSSGGTTPLQDSDGDGVPDAFELLAGSNPNQDDADLDVDRDGATLFEEYVAGTDARDPQDVLRIAALEPSPGGWTLRWRSVVGKAYRIVTTETLVDPFVPVAGSEMVATSETSAVTIPFSPDVPHAFFAIEVSISP